MNNNQELFNSNEGVNEEIIKLKNDPFSVFLATVVCICLPVIAITAIFGMLLLGVFYSAL